MSFSKLVQARHNVHADNESLRTSYVDERYDHHQINENNKIQSMTFGNLPYIAIAKPVGYLETKLLNAAQLVLRTQAYVTQLSPFSARKENTISLTFVLQGNSLTQMMTSSNQILRDAPFQFYLKIPFIKNS